MTTENSDFLLTIAIPTYNRKNLLKRALDSIVLQLNSKVEILVSDNASDDGTDEMIAKYFPMVHYIKNETNMGIDYNFLQCYRKARGDYVILFGSDDRLAAGSINYLINFLENNNCDLVFMNYRFYDVTREEVYLKNGEHIKNYKTKHDIVTKDRKLFMKYGYGFTFISSSVVKRLLLLEVKDSERFIGTNFIHTCIMLEAIKDKQPVFGVIMQPLIEANATIGQSEMSKTPERHFEVFGKCMYHVLCIQAVECGFQKRQMKKFYVKYLRSFPFWKTILSAKRRNNSAMLENFWKDGYPVVKHFPSEWIMVMLAALTPHCVINVIYKIHKAFKKEK